MGNKKTNEKNAAAKAAVLARKQQKELQAKQEMKKLTNKILLIAAAVVLAIVLIVVIVKVTEPPLDEVVSVTSPSYELNNAVMAYFFYDDYNSFIATNSAYLSYYGLSPTISLKQQDYGSGTWFDYFVSRTKSAVTELIVLAEAAKADGVALDDNDKAYIDRNIQALSNIADANGYSLNKYLEKNYCKGVTEAAVREAMELLSLATKYYYSVNDSFSFEDKDIEDYLDKNPATFYKADYLYYTLKSDVPKDATDDEKKTINEATKKLADELAACKTQDDFKKWVEDYLKSTDEDISDKDLEKALDSLLFTGKSYGTSTKVEKWVFDKETSVNDTFVSEGTNQYTVYMMVNTQYKDTYATKNVRHILFSSSAYGSLDAAKAKAEEVLALYNNGDKTPEAFAELAKKYSEDSGSSSIGGKYLNVIEGQMVTEFDKWIYDEARKEGDVAIVKTSFGYHIILFEGNGVEAWKSLAISALKSEKYTTTLDSYNKLYTVNFDTKKLNKIPA